MGENILIIKLGAKGDVVRTLPLAKAIKSKYPQARITWITKPEATQIFEGNPYVNKIFPLPFTTNEKFEQLYNFDIEEEATSLAKKIEANKKYGFYSKEGFAMTFNLGAEYYLNTLFDDELKKTNTKTYQQMMFEVAELPYNKEHCPIYLAEREKAYSLDFLKENNLNNKKIIGIHMGAGPRWPSKAWSKTKIKEFIIKTKQKGYEILLFGGKDEEEDHGKFIQELRSLNIKIYHNNPKNTDREFASLVDICNKMVCSDSFALHISLALKKQTACLCFCTSPTELEDYGILKKVVSPMLYDFFPEKQDQYSEELVNSISVEEVIKILGL